MAAVGGVAVVQFVAFIVGAGGRASLWPFLDNFLTTLGVPGGHFGTLGVHFGGLGPPGDPNGDSQGSKVDFLWILCALWDHLGGHFGSQFGICCTFLHQKLRLGCRPAF